MMELSTEEFEELVADALDSLPPELGREMENVAIYVDDTSPPGHLLGLYEGIPLTARGTSYTAAMPDRITIFKATVLRQARTHADVVATVRKTVIHEIAHHFGISDPRLDEL
ncbi:MAG: metallopeptidase family protein, partial [Actinobacteria bacterium]|nr:metallopeptidase family protein [Actinomycetota bacterium]